MKIRISKMVRAKHNYRCEKCGKIIKQGKEYMNSLIQDNEGRYRSAKFHIGCYKKAK